jgi:hypothetical protein
MAVKSPKTIATINFKGVGKTTVTWCLADTLGRRVAGVVSGSEVCQRVTACIPVGRYAGR